MSNSQIPNLSTLRRGGARVRNRGGQPPGSTSLSQDQIIQNTDNDAATSRLSAVQAGYLNDPFATLLTDGNVQRRLPLMNRGTYVRTKGIDKLVQTFLSSHSGRKQIISLGAGSDTRYFRLKQQHPDLDIVYHEIDFDVNVKAKMDRMNKSAQTIKALSGVEVTVTEGQIRCPDYHVHARDLRGFGSTASTIPGILDLPTLLLSECCLIYLSPQDADAVLEHFANIVPSPVAVIIYEPIRPNDPFGQTMIKNLTARGIHLQTLQKYSELSQQRQRLRELGFTPRAADIDFIWRKWIDETEKERIDQLEWLDEVEEFILLAKHYCISWGWKGFHDDQEWQQLPEE